MLKKYLPWRWASSSSRSEGEREPSAPVKVPAPQGEPARVAGWSDRLESDYAGALTAADFLDVGEDIEGSAVPKRDVNDTVVGEGGNGGKNG